MKKYVGEKIETFLIRTTLLANLHFCFNPNCTLKEFLHSLKYSTYVLYVILANLIFYFNDGTLFKGKFWQANVKNVDRSDR